jgi:glycosyltransferase involved in cell wall biosynthesis
MSRRPLVSILTPSFNQAAWLRENLRSVSEQTYANIEHVVMDGGSTDDSVEILRRADARVRWRSQNDRGQSHALNLALSASGGEIIGWLNSDDAYFDRSVLSTLSELSKSNLTSMWCTGTRHLSMVTD